MPFAVGLVPSALQRMPPPRRMPRGLDRGPGKRWIFLCEPFRIWQKRSRPARTVFTPDASWNETSELSARAHPARAFRRVWIYLFPRIRPFKTLWNRHFRRRGAGLEQTDCRGASMTEARTGDWLSARCPTSHSSARMRRTLPFPTPRRPPALSHAAPKSIIVRCASILPGKRGPHCSNSPGRPGARRASSPTAI